MILLCKSIYNSFQSVLQTKSICRFFNTSSILQTKTKWSTERIRKNCPFVYLPPYLIDKKRVRGQIRSGRHPISGRIVVWHRGGGHKRNFRYIDFLRAPTSFISNPLDEAQLLAGEIEPKEIAYYRDRVLNICYDPNRSSRVALVAGNASDRYRLILAAEGMKPGDIIVASRGPPPENAILNPGDAFPLKYLSSEIKLYNIERFPGYGGFFCRAAGTYAQIVGRDSEKKVVTISTKLMVAEVSEDCMAHIGVASNGEIHNQPIGKAGRNRNLGIRPSGRYGLHRRFNKRIRGRRTHHGVKSKTLYI